MILLCDIGNTHTHLGLAQSTRVWKARDMPTASWTTGQAAKLARRFIGRHRVTGLALCSVVPKTTPSVHRLANAWNLPCLELTPKTLSGTDLGIDYPDPNTIGPDRLANALAVQHHYGAPAVVVDFGTAVTFDVVDRKGNYVGGIIAPGLAAMTEYLHEKTALLPRIQIREVRSVIGRNTEQAMLIGAVHGYRGLVRELLKELKLALHCRQMAVVATGGYAELIAGKVPEITAVEPHLTLEGLRLLWTRSGDKQLPPAGPAKSPPVQPHSTRFKLATRMTRSETPTE
jgi:type III pantothenate kinase